MIILSSKEFNTEPISSERSCIFLNNVQTDKNINGNYMELCIKTDHKYIVFMTDDIPHENMLHIHLLDQGLNVIDSATIGGPYSTGSFRNYNIQESNMLTFYFIDETEWKLELLGSKAFLFPFIAGIKGISRKYVFSQYFIIYENQN